MTLVLLPLTLWLSAPQVPTQAGVEITRLLQSGHYLAALDAGERQALEGTSPMLLDLLGLVQSTVGLEEETLASFDAMGGTRRPALEASPLDGAQALAAIPTIVEAARGRRVVILNESHHRPRHRAFALELARALRDEGFDTFAAETFMDVAGLVERGYPTASTGFYTLEPVFAELVRGVLDLGYRPVPYEIEPSRAVAAGSPRERINRREVTQARNLLERVFEVDPDARLFVYVGYSHATEDWVDRGGEGEVAWMAARLAELTGFDPLTIDQTTALPRSEPAFEDPDWRRVADRLEGPALFRTESGEPFVTGSYAGKVDLQVFHPRTRLVHGRPDWLLPGRRAVSVPDPLVAKLARDERVLLQAFHADEGPDALPADQFVVTGTNDLPAFLLRPGDYRLAAQDETGETFARLEGLAVE